MTAPEISVRRWSSAIREIEVLEPWLTESQWDEHYWDDVALLVVEDPRSLRGRRSARRALKDALRRTFPGTSLKSDNGFYRDHLDERLDRIVILATTQDPAS